MDSTTYYAKILQSTLKEVSFYFKKPGLKMMIKILIFIYVP
jgi:hypothetical protein